MDPEFVGNTKIPTVPKAIIKNEINKAFPVPNLSEKKPPPIFPNKENQRFKAASVAPKVTVAPKIEVAYGVK